MTAPNLPRRLIASHGPMFPVNIMVLGALAAGLVVSIVFLQDGITPKSDLFVRGSALGLVLTLGYLACVLGRRGNARLLAVLAAAAIAGELSIRAAGTFMTRIPDDVDWRQPKPYVMFTGPAGKTMNGPPQMGGSDADRKTRFNAEGFRADSEIVVPKPADELRIFVVGGSTVVHGAPLANTIPGVIEAELRAGGISAARVYNFGVVSAVSGQELSLLVHRLIDLEPDLVIAYDGGNDLFQPWFYDPRPGYPFNFTAWEAAIDALSRASAASRKTIAGLATDSALLQALLGTRQREIRTSVEDQRREAGYGSSDWKRAAVDIYARNVAAMCRISRASGILFAGFFQPMLPYSASLDDRQMAMSGGADIVRNLREQRNLVPGAMAARLSDVRPGAGCRFVDLSGMFEDAGTERFWDLIHVDNDGNRLIGRRIAEDILAWGALPLRHPAAR